MRLTSIEAYYKAEASGLLSGLRLRVLKEIAESVIPPTAREVAEGIQDHQLDSVRPRFAELEQMRAIRPAGERRCGITLINATVWELTGDDIIPLDKVYSGASSKINALEKENSELLRRVILLEREVNALKDELSEAHSTIATLRLTGPQRKQMD